MAGVNPNRSELSTALCPQCGEKLKVQLGRPGSRIICSNRDCRAKLDVDSLQILERAPAAPPLPLSPSPSKPAEQPALQIRKKKRRTEHELHIPSTVKSSSKPKRQPEYRTYDPLAEEDPPDPEDPEPRRKMPRELPPPDRRELDAPPRWTFFSGVFTFPWHRSTLRRWLSVAVGCMAVCVLGGIAATLAFTAHGPSPGVLAALVIPALCLAIWTFGFATASSLAIVEETSGGYKDVLNWPESSWRDWLAELTYVGYLALMSSLVGYAVCEYLSTPPDPVLMQPESAALAEFTAARNVSRLIAMTIGIFVLFPVLLLSSLESGSMWAPLSTPILRSLVLLWWGWLLFYLEAAFIAAIYMGLLVAGVRYSPFWTVLLTAPLLAAGLFIYARLLGRLAWKAAELEPEETEDAEAGIE